jgi:hypothetical protein
VEAALPPGVREACRELAQALAAETGAPVAVVVAPGAAGEAVRALGDAAAVELVSPPAPPPPMGAAPFVWRADGRPDWAAMWTTFCELALYGGPPHRGEAARLEAGPGAGWADTELLAELRRGIWETTGLYAEPARPGWIAVTCDSPRMSAWLCAAIILENVEARCEDERLLLPAGPGFELGDQVKSVITVLAKTHHYWRAHLAASVPDGGA